MRRKPMPGELLCYTRQSSLTHYGRKWGSTSHCWFSTERGSEMRSMTAFDPHMKIGAQMVQTFCLRLNLPRNKAQALAREQLQAVNLEDTERILSAFPNQLSGGMLQRVSMACLGGLAPRYILADEPTSALDEENRNLLLTLLQEKYHSAGILFVSHDVSALKMLCRETMILEQGTMIERQNTEMLFAHPQQAWTQAFVHAAETRKGGEWTWKALYSCEKLFVLNPYNIQRKEYQP